MPRSRARLARFAPGPKCDYPYQAGFFRHRKPQLVAPGLVCGLIIHRRLAPSQFVHRFLKIDQLSFRQTRDVFALEATERAIEMVCGDA